MSTLLFISSCIKHEIIPAPEKKATLKAYFNGTVKGFTTEFTQNVNGYYGLAANSQEKKPAGQTSSITYIFTMKSNSTSSAISVELGSIKWDEAVTSGPSLSTFNAFFNSTLTPSYKNNGIDGFAVSYTDNTGNVWASKDNSPYNQTVQFANVSQESDANGDYSKFTCVFSCYVYRSYGSPAVTDSMLIQNAQVKGWFQR